MKRSVHVSAPVLAATALGLLSGCHQDAKLGVAGRQVVSVRDSAGAGTTRRNGFGETYGPWILGGVAFFVILRAGS